MRHGFLSGQAFLHSISDLLRGLVYIYESYLVVVAEKLVQEVDSLVTDKSLVLGADKAMPRLLLETPEDVIVLRIELNLVLVEIVEKVISAEDLGDLDKLVGVALSVEERLLSEDHGGEHGSQTPHVQAVIVLLEVHQQFWSLEVAGCDANIVFGARVVELSQAPVDETQLGDT